ncbi:MAG: MAPEG family protein [Sphingopyxis sp.]|nr:MAPEG family protein [Sphingopyxis sp.]
MIFTVTPAYALPVAAIYLILWFRVTAMRSAHATSIGDGGNTALLQRIRQHGNCAEWSGFVLMLMILAEGMGAPALYLHISGVLLLIGRIAHPFGLKIDNAGHPLRYVGNGTNILAALNAMICIGVNLVIP